MYYLQTNQEKEKPYTCHVKSSQVSEKKDHQKI